MGSKKAARGQTHFPLSLVIIVSSFGSLKHPDRDDYIQRIQGLIPFQWNQVALKKSPSKRGDLLPEEAKFLKKYANSEFFLLDDAGRELNSDELSAWLFRGGHKHLVVGPAIGWHSDFRSKAKGSLSLSRLTMTHGLAQVVLAEAIYRSACIFRKHPFVK